MVPQTQTQTQTQAQAQTQTQTSSLLTPQSSNLDLILTVWQGEIFLSDVSVRVHALSRQSTNLSPCRLRHLLKSSTHTHKVVVFGHHRAVLDGVLRGLLRHSIGAVRIDGETLVRQRAERIRDFHADPAIRVAIVSVTAGGQGINLSCASLAVFFEIPPDCGCGVPVLAC